MSSSPAAPVPRGETESAIPAMCNRIRGLKEWSEIPRNLTRPLINFEYNPNVAPTEQVPTFLAERGKPPATRMARFGINLASSGGKRRPPLLNARTDNLRRGSFKTILANRRCVIPAEGFYEWRDEDGREQPYVDVPLAAALPLRVAAEMGNSDHSGGASIALMSFSETLLTARFTARTAKRSGPSAF